MLRAGAPNIASHILSNHYNETRAEYYRQLDRASKTGSLTSFIRYAVQGLRDGLLETLKRLPQDRLNITWRSYIYDTFAPIRLEQRNRSVFTRQRRLALDMPAGRLLTVTEMVTASRELTREYAGAHPRTINRDITLLLSLGLIRRDGRRYIANTRALRGIMPMYRDDPAWAAAEQGHDGSGTGAPDAAD